MGVSTPVEHLVHRYAKLYGRDPDEVWLKSYYDVTLGLELEQVDKKATGGGYRQEGAE